ncbi:hypothetical protein IKE72_00360 [Candidatus Saccharibacteria bacterium]|nr:hypothetical protein [Candidatus Saccharibacteria bacterium]
MAEAIVATRNDIKKYAKSARTQKRTIHREISATNKSQRKNDRKSRSRKVLMVIRRVLGLAVIIAQFIGSVLIVAALFRSEALSMWLNLLIIMGLTLLLFLTSRVLI